MRLFGSKFIMLASLAGELLSEFDRKDIINKKMNATFPTPISKVPNTLELRDYRPISLCDIYINFWWRFWQIC